MSNMYNDKFFDGMRGTSSQSAEIVVPLILDLLNPQSVVDVGCGTGAWLSEFSTHGVDILGIDGDYVDRERLQIDKDKFMPLDVSDLSDQALKIDRNFDLAMSLEVAEHLPREGADAFVKFITSLAPIVIFSAAVPGQGGRYHINEQWPEYWHEKFKARRYVAFDVLRESVWDNPEVEPWYIQNSFLYVHESCVDSLKKMDELKANLPARIIHPELFRRFVSMEYIHSWPMIFELLRRIRRKIIKK